MKLFLAAVIAMVVWAAIAGFGAFYGWWLSPIAPAGDSREFMAAAVSFVEEHNRGNTAFVLIENGDVFGEHYATSGDDVDSNTLFPAASMSKWVTAWGVMKLVENGSVDLDRPLDTYLTRWQLPPSDFDNTGVTVRRLLSHTAGLTDGLGFGDYEPDESLPSLEESLADPRSSSGDTVVISVGAAPGSEWRYSGGGYLILELLVEEISKESFDTFMKRSILLPLGMSRSTFGYAGGLENVASSYDELGKPAILYRYAASGATGFSTTAADMVRFIQAQLAEGSSPLSSTTMEAMREPHGSSFGADIWGLGTMLYAPTASGDFVFGHDGRNEPAINAAARINPDTGDAFVLLTTGNTSLASSLGFQWVLWQTGVPDFLAIDKVLESTIVPIVIGCGAILVFFVIVGLRRRRRS